MDEISTDLAAERLRAHGWTVWSPEEREGMWNLVAIGMLGLWAGLMLGGGRHG